MHRKTICSRGSALCLKPRSLSTTCERQRNLINMVQERYGVGCSYAPQTSCPNLHFQMRDGPYDGLQV